MQEEYKFSVKDVAATITSTDTTVTAITTDAEVIDVHANDALDMDISITVAPVTINVSAVIDATIDNVYATVNDSSATVADAEVTDVSINEAADGTDTPVTSAATDDANNDVDENLSDSSIEEEAEPNQADKQKHQQDIERKKKTPKERMRHTCKQCNRTFDRPNKMMLHVRKIHEGIRDHACDQCDKRYATPYELQAHARIHSG